jgi:hypothetical protein
MKRYYRLALSILTGMLLGAFLMGLYHRQVLRRQSEDPERVVQKKADEWAFETFQLRIIEDVNVLIGLRRGEIDSLIEIREKALSSEIVAFHSTFPTEVLSNTNSIRILRTAARYRAEHPFKTGDADVDTVVEELLKNEYK